VLNVNVFVTLIIVAAVIGIAASVVLYRRFREAEAARIEGQKAVWDFLEANTMLRASAFQSFKALFHAARRW
jgi:hypothetical protein